MSVKIIVLLVIISVSVMCDDPWPLLPRKFTVAYRFTALNDDDHSFNGKFWLQFDAQDNFVAFRMDILNTFPCGDRFPGATTCIQLTFPDKAYVFAPQEGLCDVVRPQFEIRRDSFTDMEYLGIRELDGQKFYQFYKKTDQIYDIGIDYLTDMSGDFKPRRLGRGFGPDQDIMYYDSNLNSYSDNFNSTTVFQIPKYCQDIQSTVNSNLRTIPKISFLQKLTKLFSNKKVNQSQ